MRLSVAIIALTLHFSRNVDAQTCDGVSGRFVLSDLTGDCTYDVLLEEYTRQVFDATGSTCAGGSTLTAKEDLDAKLMEATGKASGEEGGDVICKAMYDNAVQTPFTSAAAQGTDLHFEQMFYNGRTEWQEEVETHYETHDETATSVLKEDARKVDEFYRGAGQYSRVKWPDQLTNFDESTCSSHAAMCCWPKDRQANDGNGNCARPYDENCVNKDPADNTNLCFADYEAGNKSTGLDSGKGFAVFPFDNNDGEGAIHCHGFAWADDEYDSISRYKANNLFFVSMYDHMYQRGYVKNIPGMPMCGCMDQMPIATRSDCTQVDLTEDWEMVYDGTAFTGHLTKVEIDFNACRGRNNRNNDLWAYAARLYDQGRMTAQQFGKVGRVLTNDHDCYHAVEYAKAAKGFVTDYAHDEENWTKVAGRDDLKSGEPYGRAAFNSAFSHSQNNIIMRICPDCVYTHRRIFYKRRTEIPDGFDLLRNILYYRNSEGAEGNRWGEDNDFTLHSTYEDAVSGANPWECPDDSFNYGAPFVGDCSPDGTRVRDQYSIWNWFPGPRPNVAYYIDKPEDVGVRDYIDNDSITRAAGLTDIDIGFVGLAGNTLEDNGTYHITGSGSDIWSNNDQFHYKSQPWSGDIDVSVRLTEFSNPGGNEWAKAGIMLRSDNSNDATYAFMMLSGGKGYHAQTRLSKAKHSDILWGTTYPHDYQTSPYLRIVKKQTVIEFYLGENGADDWILQSTETVFFPDDTYRVGLAVTSHNNYFLSEATFEDYQISTYEFPSAAPSHSAAPSVWEPKEDINLLSNQYDGTFNVVNGIDNVSGSGTGIWGTSDSFFFYNHWYDNGNLSVEMHIRQFKNGDNRSRGGIMIRDGNDQSAANAFVGAAGNYQGAVFQSRSAAGESTSHHKMIFVNWSNEFWVKLEKVNSTVTAYYKVFEEDDWIELGETSLTLTGPKVTIGRAVTKGSVSNYYNTMQAEHFKITV